MLLFTPQVTAADNSKNVFRRGQLKTRTGIKST